MVSTRNLVVVGLLLLTTNPIFADLEKARTLRSNGLNDEAKKALVEVVYDEEAAPEAKAEALLILGEIAVDEENFAGARDNWSKLTNEYPSTEFAERAQAKLELLEKLVERNEDEEAPPNFPPNTVLVVGPSEYPWAALEIAGALGDSATVFEEGLNPAVKIASSDPKVVGVVEVSLKVDVAFESGRVTCYDPSGKNIWKDVVRMTYPGSEEQIARRFVKKLAKKIEGWECP